MNSITQKIKNSEYFIIAEIGLNHDGSLGDSFRLIEEAKKAKVDAVKFQLHISNKERIIEAPTPSYFKLENRDEYFNRTSFNLKEWIKLKNYAHELELYFIVSPFSHAAVDVLEKTDIDAYKIASGETTNIPLLEYINSKNKPILLSTGMSNWNEIEKATNILRENLIVLFQCSSEYPCSAENVGLNVINEMIEKFKDLTIGFSDHTLSNCSSIAAYLMGAKVFEKHFTLSKKKYGPDVKCSLDPKEMKYYVDGLDFISKALKTPVNKDDIKKYNEVKKRYEKSIVASKNLNKGHILMFQDLDFKKPGDGIRADKYKVLIGKKLLKDVKKDEKIIKDYINSN